MEDLDTTTAANRGSEKQTGRVNYTTSAKIQRLQILAHLLAGNSLETQQARLDLCQYWQQACIVLFDAYQMAVVL